MRITGGAFRSRPLRAPRGAATRPTSDRVREALFSILTARLTLRGARVLDLYAGTGALALEALSRGASHATMVERSNDALRALRENVAALGVASDVRVVASPVTRALTLLSGGPAFDLVFADPPYADVPSGDAQSALSALVDAGLLTPGGCLVLEHAKGDAAPELAGLDREDPRRYGDTSLTLYVRSARATSQ